MSSHGFTVMVQTSAYTRFFLTCFCCAIVSSYVVALPELYLSRPSFGNEMISWRNSEMPGIKESQTFSTAEKRAMMRLGKRVVSRYHKRAIMRLGK
ncbi:hypothetical protein GCK32_000137 [Trichostrongylus colubriformis]|uniref:Uncharacterized protein n=1 Tax=Trichostrongylus colubriformis TaxID=6319 RepID=A0AAN8FJC7_TRICO